LQEMKIVCVAVIGKANNPLYIKSFDLQVDSLKFHFIIHSSLDVVEEKISSLNTKKSPDLYLGMLCPSEDYRVFGYVTNTKNKLIVIVDDYDPKESEIKSFFKTFHSHVANALSNPFHTIDEQVTNKLFDREITQLVKKKSDLKDNVS